MYVLHYAPDNASLIVRLALEEMGQAYETRLVDRRIQAQRSTAYLRLNPNGVIPVLETPDGPVFETAAILLWLADRHGALFPQVGDGGRGAALKWLIFCANTLHPALRSLFYPEKYIGPDPAHQQALCDGAQHLIATHLASLDQNWRPARIPDLTCFYVAACLRWCAIYGPAPRDWFVLDNYPALAAMVATLEDRACVAAVCHAEGLGPHPFTNPQRPNPPEGSAL